MLATIKRKMIWQSLAEITLMVPAQDPDTQFEIYLRSYINVDAHQRLMAPMLHMGVHEPPSNAASCGQQGHKWAIIPSFHTHAKSFSRGLKLYAYIETN